jgi:hypothetical protein
MLMSSCSIEKASACFGVRQRHQDLLVFRGRPRQDLETRNDLGALL